MRISPKLIAAIKSQRDLKSYSVWLFLKSLFKNSCIYHYSINRLSKLSGLSRTMIRKYISLFLVKGWCRIHRTSLVFLKQADMMNSRHIRLFNIKPKQFTIRGIQDSLNIFLIANKQKQILKAQGDQSKGGCSGEIPSLTVNAAAGLFKTGYRNANRILLDLQTKEWFKRTRVWLTRMSGLPPVGYAALKEAGQIDFPHFYTKRRLIEVFPSRFEWLVFLPGIPSFLKK